MSEDLDTGKTQPMDALVQTNAGPLVADLADDLDAAFPVLVRTHQNGIYSGVRRFVPGPADAEDVTKETFVRAYRALQGYSSRRIADLALSAWLWTIALNLCRNAARRRTRKPAGASLSAVKEPAAATDTEASMAGLQVRMKQQALASGPGPRRFVPERDGWWDEYRYEIGPAFTDLLQQVESHRAAMKRSAQSPD